MPDREIQAPAAAQATDALGRSRSQTIDRAPFPHPSHAHFADLPQRMPAPRLDGVEIF